MRIHLDFDNKLITLESDVNLKEFNKKIKLVLKDWEEWSLNTKTNIFWNYPPTPIYFDNPNYPVFNTIQVFEPNEFNAPFVQTTGTAVIEA